jgi:hypothetical protein
VTDPVRMGGCGRPYSSFTSSSNWRILWARPSHLRVNRSWI